MISILENDIKHVEVLFTYLFSDFLINILTIVGVGIILLSLNINIALLVFFTVILFAFIQKKIGENIKCISKNVSISKGNLNSFEQEYLENYIDIRSENRTNQFENKLWIYQKDLFEQEKKVAIIKSGTTVLGTSLQNICLILTFFVGGWQIMLNNFTIGGLFSLIIYVQRIYSPVTALFKTYMEMKKTQASFNRVQALFENKVVETGTVILKEQYKIIEFKNLIFGYNKENILFNKLNLFLKTGSSLAIVGANGTGKSTLINILLKNLGGYDGDIFINGENLKNIKRDNFYEHFAYMGQDVKIFSGTVYENVTLFDHTIDYDRVESALSQVDLLDILKEKHKGLDTQLGAGGIILSGGQAQKLNIARIILSNADILILDEPTSALDLESEKKMCKILFELFKSKIIIAVTHRPEIIDYCKNVIDIGKLSSN